MEKLFGVVFIVFIIAVFTVFATGCGSIETEDQTGAMAGSGTEATEAAAEEPATESPAEPAPEIESEADPAEQADETARAAVEAQRHVTTAQQALATAEGALREAEGNEATAATAYDQATNAVGQNDNAETQRAFAAAETAANEAASQLDAARRAVTAAQQALTAAETAAEAAYGQAVDAAIRSGKYRMMLRVLEPEFEGDVVIMAGIREVLQMRVKFVETDPVTEGIEAFAARMGNSDLNTWEIYIDQQGNCSWIPRPIIEAFVRFGPRMVRAYAGDRVIFRGYMLR